MGEATTPVAGFPLSPQQRRLWALHQAGAGVAYRAQALLQIDGPLDVDALEAALHSVVRRHEICRTTFHRVPGSETPVQVIGDEAAAAILRRDLSELASRDQDDAVDALFQADSAEALDLERGPLLRFTLARLSPERHRLLVLCSTLCADRATLHNLLNEVARAYAQTAPDGGERPLETADGPMQYADIAAWADELLEAGEAEAGRAFWRKRAALGSDGIKLPFGSEPHPGSLFEPRSVRLRIGGDDAQRIGTLASRHGVSTAVVILAAYQTLLWRLTGGQVTVGTAFDGRRYPELQPAFGPLVRYLPVQCELTGSARFGQLVSRIAESVNQAREHQEFFAWQGFGAAGRRDADERAFLPFGFEFDPLPAHVRARAARFGIERERVCLERFLLRLDCARGAEGLTADLHYDAGAIPREDAERVAAELESLLGAALAAPETRIDELDLLSDAEKQRLILEFNDTAAPWRRGACIHELIEEQAQRTPEAAAVRFEGRELSYAELDEQANRLAHRLQAHGVGPDVLVALCLERSLEMVVAILGVLKAGGAYVPLDPKYPLERLSFMLEETDAKVLLVQQHLAGSLPRVPARVLFLDPGSAEEPAAGAGRPTSGVTPANLAYVIYTSGSTGRPKGVMVSHEGLVISNCARIGFFRQEVDRFLLLSPLAFDSSVVGIFWTLCQGGAIVLVREELQQDLARLAETIEDERVSHLLTLPSFYALVLEHARPAQLSGLRTVIVAGEPCPRRMVDRHRDVLPGTGLFSEYGATETTVWSSGYDCLAQTLLVAPLGRPVGNYQMYVLDDRLKPTPTCVPGEVYFGGEGLSLGYLRRPDLTAERFVPDPFSPRPGARLYRSGDLARHLRSGDVEFLGRVDNQVKIRGYRIELEEIEAVLGAHPSVAEVAVVAREDDPAQGKRLVAYAVADRSGALSAKELRGFLKDRLPDFMIPSAFLILEALPRTPNGKVDRRALPAPGPASEPLAEDFVAPRTPAEQLMAEIWGQALGVERVSVLDNFFELGGDSILSIQVIARANQKGLRLTPRQLFQHQTVAELAAVAGTTAAHGVEQGAVTGDVPLTPVQHWFFELDLPAPQHWNMPLFLEVRQPLDPALVEDAIRALLSHHDALRLRFHRTGSAWRQTIVAADGPLPFVRIDLSGLPEAKQVRAIESAAAEWQRSLDIGAGPLLRAVWFDLGPGQPARLLLILHHLAVDGVSLRILLEDLQAGLRQRLEGQPIRLPLKTTSYREWAQRLERYATSDAPAEQLAHWRSLERASAWRMPVDRPSGVNSESSARKVSASLSPDETRALLHKVPRAYRTQINDVLLTALVEAFAEWTGRRSLLLNLEGHGREEILEGVDVSRTVGWFTTDFPVLLDLEGRHGPAESLTEIKEQLRGVPQQGIGYGVLRYLSANPAIAEPLARLPRPEVAFNYMGQFDQALGDGSLFRLARESSGPSQALEGRRPFLLEIYGMVSEGQLTLDWEYSAQIFERGTVERLARCFLRALRSLIEHCLSPEAGEYTASDLAAYNWSKGDLDEIAAAIRRSQDRV